MDGRGHTSPDEEICETPVAPVSAVRGPIRYSPAPGMEETPKSTLFSLRSQSCPFSSLLCALFYATLVPSLVQTTSLSRTSTTYIFWARTTGFHIASSFSSRRPTQHFASTVGDSQPGHDSGYGTCVGPRTARHAFLDGHIKLERKLIERLPSLPKQTHHASPSHFCTAESSPPTVPIFRLPHSLMGSPRLPTAELRAPDSGL